MLPSPFVALVLVFAAFRLTRLVGWDDWPPIVKLRVWLIGEYWVPVWIDDARARLRAGEELEAQRLTLEHTAPLEEGEHPLSRLGVGQPAEPPLPGKTPSSEVSDVRPAWRRPLLAHLVHCPFCQGFWVSCAVYAAWLLEPTGTLYVLAPFALSGAVGIVAKNLDA